MIVASLRYARKIVDYTLIWADSKEELEGRMRTVLQRCKEGITISMKKFEIGSKLKFAGHIVSDEGIRPNPEQLDAINTEKPSKHQEIPGYGQSIRKLCSRSISHVKTCAKITKEEYCLQLARRPQERIHQNEKSPYKRPCHEAIRPQETLHTRHRRFAAAQHRLRTYAKRFRW